MRPRGGQSAVVERDPGETFIDAHHAGCRRAYRHQPRLGSDCFTPSAMAGGTYKPYPFPAPTPRDAYREGLINRWKLEQLEGPLPAAMQGPSPDGTRGGDGGGSGGFGGG
jgi:hypothetical protein